MHSMPELLEAIRLMLDEKRRQQVAAEIVREKLARWRASGRVDTYRR